MEKIKVKKTYRTFKVGNYSFSAEAFHPPALEKGIYVAYFRPIGLILGRFEYFEQVRAKNGSQAIIKAKKGLRQALLKRKKESRNIYGGHLYR